MQTTPARTIPSADVPSSGGGHGASSSVSAMSNATKTLHAVRKTVKRKARQHESRAGAGLPTSGATRNAT